MTLVVAVLNGANKMSVVGGIKDFTSHKRHNSVVEVQTEALSM